MERGIEGRTSTEGRCRNVRSPRSFAARRAQGGTCRSRARPKAGTLVPFRRLPAARRSSRKISSIAPNQGREPAVCVASKRLPGRLSPRPPDCERAAKPLRRCVPRSSSQNRPPTSRRVDSQRTTVPGSASVCRRAARLGVSPMTESRSYACWLVRSPTTTWPVAMPIRRQAALLFRPAAARPPRPSRGRRAPHARHRPRAPAASRKTPARHHPKTWRHGPQNGRSFSAQAAW